MNKFIITSLIVLLSYNHHSVHAQQSEKASSLLAEVSEKMASYQNMYIKFKYTLENKEVAMKQESEGIVYTKGEKYHLNFMGNLFIFDGEKTFIILEEDEEVNIIDGNSEEDLLTPTKLFHFYKEGYNYQLAEKETVNEKQLQNIKLIPIDSQSESAYFLLRIDLPSKNIEEIVNIGNNGTETIFTIKEFVTNQELPESLFSFDRNKYVDYIINE